MKWVMSVNPGFGGQKFIENTIKKTAQARELIDRTGSKALIEIDGGVNLETGAGNTTACRILMRTISQETSFYEWLRLPAKLNFL